MKAVPYAKEAETKPVETDLESLRSRVNHFNNRLTELDGLIEQTRQDIATALVEENTVDEAELSGSLRELQNERENLIEAAKIAEAKISEREVQLKEIHDAATQREANLRWKKVAPAAKKLDAALKAADEAAVEFETALENVRKMGGHKTSYSTMRQLFRQWFYNRGPNFVHLIADHAARGSIIQRPVSLKKDATPLAELFADDESKKPFPKVQ